jgi:hypothetical protein
MNDVLGHHLILVAAATAICTMSYVSGWPRRPVQPEPEVAAIVIVPQTEPRSRAPSVRVPEVPVPQDMASLIREIQRELKHLGCYERVSELRTPLSDRPLTIFQKMLDGYAPGASAQR